MSTCRAAQFSLSLSTSTLWVEEMELTIRLDGSFCSTMWSCERPYGHSGWQRIRSACQVRKYHGENSIKKGLARPWLRTIHGMGQVYQYSTVNYASQL